MNVPALREQDGTMEKSLIVFSPGPFFFFFLPFFSFYFFLDILLLCTDL